MNKGEGVGEKGHGGAGVMSLDVIMQESFQRAILGGTYGNGKGNWGGDCVMSDMDIWGSG